MNTIVQLDIAQLTEQRAKQFAKTTSHFLKSQGIELSHTKALDLTGTLCGYANWQGLQVALSSKPVKLTFDEFFKKFKPVKNHLDENSPADGYGFETFGVELNFVLERHRINPDCIWTCFEEGDSTWITNGYHVCNRMFYLVTRKPAKANFYEIPYGHDMDDLAFDIIVRHPDTGREEHIDTRYGCNAKDALNAANIDFNEAVEGLLNEGESRIVIVTPA